MRDVEPGDLDEETMEDFLVAMDRVSNVLFRIERKRQERKKSRSNKISI